MSSEAPGEAERARMITLLAAMQRAVADARAPERLREDRRAWLADSGLAGDDLDAMADVDPRRLLLYRKLVRRGLGRTFQGTRLFRQMSVAENVLVGMDSRLRSGLFTSLLHWPTRRPSSRATS